MYAPVCTAALKYVSTDGGRGTCANWCRFPSCPDHCQIHSLDQSRPATSLPCYPQSLECHREPESKTLLHVVFWEASLASPAKILAKAFTDGCQREMMRHQEERGACRTGKHSPWEWELLQEQIAYLTSFRRRWPSSYLLYFSKHHLPSYG